MQPPRVLFVFSSISLFTLLACSNTDPGARGTAAGGLEVPMPDRGVQLGLKVEVEPGKEIVVCREMILPGSAAIEVGRLEHVSSPGTHHVHAYRTSTPPDKVSPDAFDCGDLAGPLFYTTEKEAESTRFHPGVGLKFTRGEVVRLELHYLNTGTTATEVEVRLNLWYAEAPITVEAGSFFMYNHAISVPPHGKQTTKMHCEIPVDISILSLLPHVHTHGKAERIYVSDKGLEASRLLVDSRGYGDLETRGFDEAPLVVKAGQALDFECDFENGSEKELVEGSSPTTAEMCALLGNYYPRLPAEAEWCTLPGSGPLP